VPVARRIAILLLGVALIVGAAGALWIPYASSGESSRIRLALLVVCVSLLILLSRLGLPVFHLLKPNLRGIADGILVLLVMYPWTLVVGLAVRYGLLPNNLVGGLVLLIPLAICLVMGLYLVVRGTFGRS
jgi:hypothetical protein